MFKLLVIEPWEFGTLNGVGPFNVTVQKAAKDNWLLLFDVTIKYKNQHTRCLLSKAQRRDTKVNLIDDLFGSIVLEMAIIPYLNETNFMDYDLDDYRGEFLTGELSK